MPPASGPRKVKVRVKKAPALKPSVLTAPLGNAAAPILKAQHQAHVNTQRAQRKVEAKVVVPYVPKLKHPTSAQRGAAQSLVAGSLHRQGITTAAQVKALPPAQRVRVNRATGYANTNAKQVNAARALAAGQSGTQTQLAKIGRQIIAQTSAQILPGPKHKRVGIPGVASIDLTSAERSIGKHLAGNPIAAIAKAVPAAAALTAKQKGVIGLSGRALQDAIDLPANTVTSLYYVGKQGATGHPLNAAKALINPVVQTIEHPAKSFSQHPLNTVLILRGAKGAVGHSAGKAMSTGALGSTAKQAASTQRAPLEIPGARRVITRQYNRDPSSKAVQVAAEKIQVRRAKRKGNPPPAQASPGQIRQSVAADVAAEKIQSQRNAADVQAKAKKALGYKRGKGPTAATNLVAQGITNASHADLQTYLREIKAAAPQLKGDRLKRNQEAQKLIGDALKNHNPAKVQDAARAYQQFVATTLEPKALAANLVEPTVAETTRLTGVRVRRNATNGTTKQARKMASRGQNLARLEADHAEAAYAQAVADAKTAARVNGGRVPPAQHDALLRAIGRRDNALGVLQSAKTAATQARIVHTRQQLAPGEQPAYVSQQPIPARTPALPAGRVTAKVKAQRTGEGIRQGTLDVHPIKLVEQAGQTQRLIDAAGARERFAQDYGFREHGAQTVRRFDNGPQARTYARKNQMDEGWAPFRRQDGSTVLVHKTALSEVKAFEKGVNTAPALKSYTSRWRRLVLAFSPRWLAGNTFEAAVRAVVAGAGPTSYATAKRNMKALGQVDPRALGELKARTISGGQYTVTDRLARERATAQEMGKLGRAIHRFGQTPAPKLLGYLYGQYTRVVFGAVNGRLETVAQTAMLGKAMRQHPLMSEHVVGLSAKAAQEAAQGLRNTPTMVELGRQVDRMYGQYGKFSPGLQNAIANYTPFIAWTLNATRFLVDVLPRDHPVLTGLLASANIASESWRKQHGLYLDALGHTKGQMSGWLQGSIPGANNSHLRLSRYTPFGLVSSDTGPLGGVSGVLLPQLMEIVHNFGGEDWSGKKLTDNPNFARAAAAVAVSLIENQVPVSSQIVGAAGVHLPNEADRTKHSGSLGTRLREQFDPTRYTPAKKVTAGKGKDPLLVKYGLGAGSNLDDLAKKYGVGQGTTVDDLAKKYGLK